MLRRARVMRRNASGWLFIPHISVFQTLRGGHAFIDGFFAFVFIARRAYLALYFSVQFGTVKLSYMHSRLQSSRRYNKQIYCASMPTLCVHLHECAGFWYQITSLHSSPASIFGELFVCCLPRNVPGWNRQIRLFYFAEKLETYVSCE